MSFHPLHTDIPLPEKMNNPFFYEPHPLCLLAAKEIQAHIPQLQLNEGKMFGTLIVKRGEELGYLAAYSGQIEAIDEKHISEENYFVPAVFDYLNPKGYFKINEHRISLINKEITKLSTSYQQLKLRQEYQNLEEKSKALIVEKQTAMKIAKAKRDKTRQTRILTEEEQLTMTRESQYLKAEVHRAKLQYKEKLQLLRQEIEKNDQKIALLKLSRKQQSDQLQQWLFSQFNILNKEGKTKNLLDIFQDTAAKIPPAGSGECCEPKLLQYAFANHYEPICMAMFWWGPSPKTEIRHHLHYYPACNGKCKPILLWMLQGLNIEDNLLNRQKKQEREEIYSDHDLIVVYKPAGMLSVPGKNIRESVLSILKERYPKATGPMIVHRLDMATSGLLVVTKNLEAYINLQKQFAEHTIKKRYVALLEHIPDQSIGIVDLPLLPDIMDRPRQKVDKKNGKKAITKYQVIAQNRVWLYPLTGRTHQLRMHCAHEEGLNNPILGDNLYGKPADRLYLHAEYLEFTHPSTGKRIHFEYKAPF